MKSRFAEATLAQLFSEARSYSSWQSRPVEDSVLHELYQLASFGPTSANCCPARFVFVRSAEAKERLLPLLYEMNRHKVQTAPVTVIIGQDTRFYESMNVLLPHNPKLVDMFRNMPPFAELTALRNSTLQGAYLIMAARALGLDTGPMSGFDNAGIDATFFPDGRVKSNFLCCVGYGDSSALHPRLPRLGFDDACSVL